jgi:hypothetical protein
VAVSRLCFNHERPHQALNMKYPAELYSPSPRPYIGLSEVEYPFHDRTITVTQCGRICIGRRKINLSGVFAGQNVGITEVSEKIWLVSFVQYDLGFFDQELGMVTSAENPFGAKVFPCARNGPRWQKCPGQESKGIGRSGDLRGFLVGYPRIPLIDTPKPGTPKREGDG